MGTGDKTARATARLLLTSMLVLSMMAVGLVVTAQPAASQGAEITPQCYRIAWSGEDSEFGEDEQIFAAEIDGTRRVKVSGPNGSSSVLGNDLGGQEWMPDGRIAFVDYDSFDRFWIADADGGNPQATDIVSRGEYIYSVSVAPDGSRLAYVAGAIEIVSLTGGPTQLISADARILSWSPDSSQLAWTNSSGITVADADGSNETLVYAGEVRSAANWSPDGTKFVWSDGSTLLVANTDGSNITTIVTPGEVQFAGNPAWSPDGSQIAYYVYDDDYSRVDVIVANADGSNPNVIGLGGSDERSASMSWSPDGAYVAWTTLSDVIVSSPDGSVQKRIANAGSGYGPIENFGATFSPCVFTPGSGPQNDNFADARQVDNFGTEGIFIQVAGTTVGATAETAEPAHGVGGPSHSAWWKWTPYEDVFVEVDTLGSSFDTVLAVYTGDNISDLVPVAANDDVDDTATTSRVRFTAQAGQTYHIAVDGSDSATGLVSLQARSPEIDLSECDIVGTWRRDILTGTPGPDVICGLGGDDSISGLGGDDIIVAGPGNDRVWAGSGNDIVLGGDGNDRIIAGGGDDTVVGGRGDDRLFGKWGDDTLFGNGGADRLYGAEGSDRLYGDAGDDQVYGGLQDDYVDGGRGVDVCNAGQGTDIVRNC